MKSKKIIPDFSVGDSSRMKDFKIPSEIEFILDELNKFGYEAYLVGGCVRDFILGKTPSDYDITTNALPQTVMTIFEDTAYSIGTGLSHGTVTVIKDGLSAEVTTFRIDGKYTDNRHPESILFSSDLKDDVLRRDFTVNAMAYSKKDGFVDLVDGVSDINNQIIRCVGDPETRFEEDALRILRALRFSSVLGFKIEDETSKAIFSKAKLLENISTERSSSEFVKLLCGKNDEEVILKYRDVIAVFIPEIKPTFDFEQHTPYHKYDVITHSVKATAATDVEDKILRIAAFFHDIGKPECFFTDEQGVGHFYGHAKRSMEITDTVLKSLRIDNKLRNGVLELIKNHDAPIEENDNRIKRLLRNLGAEQFFRLIKLQRADNKAQSETVFYRQERFDRVEKAAEKILAEKTCFSLSNLNINGNDLISLGIPQGKIIGIILNRLLEEVIENKLLNEYDMLVSKVWDYKGEHLW